MICNTSFGKPVWLRKTSLKETQMHAWAWSLYLHPHNRIGLRVTRGRLKLLLTCPSLLCHPILQIVFHPFLNAFLCLSIFNNTEVLLVSLRRHLNQTLSFYLLSIKGLIVRYIRVLKISFFGRGRRITCK